MATYHCSSHLHSPENSVPPAVYHQASGDSGPAGQRPSWACRVRAIHTDEMGRVRVQFSLGPARLTGPREARAGSA